MDNIAKVFLGGSLILAGIAGCESGGIQSRDEHASITKVGPNSNNKNITLRRGDILQLTPFRESSDSHKLDNILALRIPYDESRSRDNQTVIRLGEINTPYEDKDLKSCSSQTVFIYACSPGVIEMKAYLMNGKGTPKTEERFSKVYQIEVK